MSIQRSLVLGFAILLTGHGSGPPARAQAAESPQAIMHFTFRDSARGIRVMPEAVLINNKPVFNVIDEAGRMSVPIAPGDHRVVIKARGYTDLDSRQTASLDHAPMNLLMLDPATQPEELLPENLSQGMPDDGTLIVGYITDEEMGVPLAGANVELLGKDVAVKSDKNGFFKLPVAMPDGIQMPDDPRGGTYGMRDFRVTMPGYGFEEHINVLVESAAPRIYQIQMIRGGGGNSIDEAGSRNNLQSGLFGIYNVEPEDPPSTYSMPSAPNPANSATTTPISHNHSHNHDHSHENHSH